MSNYDSELPIRSVAADTHVDVETLNGQTVDLGAGNAGVGTQRVVLATDQSDVKVDLDKVAGTATAVNTGNATAGTQRVVIASDQPAIPVTVSSGSGMEKVDQATGTNIAAAATTTHTYTPAATEILDKIVVCASGQLFITVAWGTTGGETTHDYGFTTKGNLMYTLDIPNGVSIPNTDSVKLTIKNEDKQSFDIFSSIYTH